MSKDLESLHDLVRGKAQLKTLSETTDEKVSIISEIIQHLEHDALE
jgi:hypothetical protein